MSIYTKTGDKGETSLLGGKRVWKDCLEMQLIGEVDELNAALGVAILFLRDPSSATASLGMTKLAEFIQNIQRDLFKIGAELAGLKIYNQIIDLDKIGKMEKMIDEFWVKLPELQNFILPGGSAAGAHLHLARVICRRVERGLVVAGQTISLRPELYIYLNRLSDFLFAAARWVNFKAGEKEIWA